jgi:hypothetical protein
LEDGDLGVKRLSRLTGTELSRVYRTLEVVSESRPVERDPGIDTSLPWWDNAQTYQGG